MEKIPPQNIEAEESLLGSLMLDPDAIFKVSDFLNPHDFYKKAHQKIFAVMVELMDKREAIDLLSVSAKLKEKKLLKSIGGKSYLTSLVNSVPTATHASDYANIICKKRRLRDLINYGQEISESGYNEDKDVEILIDEAERKIFSVAQGGAGKNFSHLRDNLENAFNRLEYLTTEKGQSRGVPTGFVDLDNVLSGLQKSDLIVLAARPSMGKSAFASNIARNVAQKTEKAVGIFSLEMSVDQIVDRLISDISGINLWKLRTGNLSQSGENNDFVRIRESFEKLSNLPIFIDDSISFNVMQMRTMARRLQAEKDLGLIIVDYLQLMQPRLDNASPVQQMTEISRELKKLAKELDVPVLALSQLSRAVEQRTPQVPRLSDLRESGCLTGDTLIENAHTGERKPIKELVGQKNIPVHCVNKNWQTEIKNISKVFPSGRKTTYLLKTRSGFSIKASANHPFLKINGWTRLDELKKGDRIATYCEGSLFKLGKNTDHLQEMAENSKTEQGANILKKEVFWDEISSIEKLKVEEVYDATVPGLHNFLANGIFVHNSIEQDADVVMFIYREDYYREDTNRRNISDIIIAKHRNGPTGKAELYFDKETATFKNLDKKH